MTNEYIAQTNCFPSQVRIVNEDNKNPMNASRPAMPVYVQGHLTMHCESISSYNVAVLRFMCSHDYHISLQLLNTEWSRKHVHCLLKQANISQGDGLADNGGLVVMS